MNPRHRIATRAVMLTPNYKFLMFLSHFDPGSNLPPQWVFPGGGLEPGEEPIAGVVREVLEETGRKFDASQFSFLHSLRHDMDDRRYHDTGEAHFFQLLVEGEFVPSSEFWTENEHRDTVSHRWLSVAEILSEKLWVGPNGAIDLLIERYGPQDQTTPHIKVPQADNKHYVK